MTNPLPDGDLPQKLADEFSRIIRDTLTADEMLEVLRINATGVYGERAAFRFPGAKPHMTAAFKLMTEHNPEPDSEADVALWTAAWALARNSAFARKLELIQNAEGVSVYAFAIKDRWIDLPRRSACTLFPVDPMTTYGLRPEEVSALEHANDLLNARLLNASSERTIGTETVVSTASARALTGASTIGEIRRLYPNLTVWYQAGGCHSLRHDDDCGGYLLITENKNPQAPKDDASIVDVGRYSSRGDLIEEGHGLPVTDLEAWIDDTLGRAINPKTVDDYFANKLGTTVDEVGLCAVPIGSPQGRACVKAIDTAAALIALLGRSRSGHSSHGNEADVELESHIIRWACFVVEAYLCSAVPLKAT